MTVQPVTSLDINPSQSSFMINWTASTTPDITSQELWVSVDSFISSGSNSPNFDNGSPININSNISSYSLGGLIDENTYQIAVIAKTASSESSAVSAQHVSGDDPQLYGEENTVYGSAFYNLDLVPDSVSNVNIEQISNRKLKITWTTPSTGQTELDKESYNIWRNIDDGQFDILANVPVSASEYIDKISVGHTYKYRVSVLDEGTG